MWPITKILKYFQTVFERTISSKQGCKSMFKHGGILLGRNIHPACFAPCISRGVWGHAPPRENFLNGAFWCIFGSDFKKISKITIFYKIIINYHFFYKKFKNYYFLYKK